MNWLRNKIVSWLSSSTACPGTPNLKGLLVGIRNYDDGETPLHSEPLRLNVYFAIGGTIVETRRYDNRGDTSMTRLHIVPSDQELGSALAKIITMDSLRG